MNAMRQIALKRIDVLFRLAKETIRENPQLAQRYVEVARKIAMRVRLRLPEKHRRLVCKHCKKFIMPGVNCRVRTRSRREPHIISTCMTCGKHTRTALKGRNRT